MNKVEWIKCSELLPVEGEVVLITRKSIVGKIVYSGYLRGDVFYCSICDEPIDDIINVSHWVHLPELPKEEE